MYKGNMYEFIDRLNRYLKNNNQLGIENIKILEKRKDRYIIFISANCIIYQFYIFDTEDFENDLYEKINILINNKSL